MDKQEVKKRREERLIFDQEREGYYFGHCMVPEHDNYCCNVKFKGDSVGKNHFMYCEECKICWYIGRNLFSSWQDETEEDWKENYEMIKDFEIVK